MSEDAYEGSGLLFTLLVCFAPSLWIASVLLGDRPLRWRWCVADIILVSLLAWLTVATFSAPSRGTSLNLLVEWFGLAVTYWMFREVVIPRHGRERILSWLIGLGSALACYATYQAFWGLEQLRREFHRDPEMMLRSLGIVPGSPQAQTFLNRLNSHEAFATFALANSLAGFLLPLATVAILRFFRTLVTPSARRSAVLCNTLLVLVLITGTLLTQSRSAVALILVTVVVTGGLTYSRSVRRGWVHLAVLVLAITGVLVLGRSRGKFDEQFLTGASLSLKYRIEYWVGTASLIRDHPWVGVGPGNFRSWYLRYKLPYSSEEISDPHNFLLELAASGGIPAAIAFLGFLAGVVATLARRNDSRPAPAENRVDGTARGLPFGASTVAAVLLALWVGGLELPVALAVTLIWLGAAWTSIQSDANITPTDCLVAATALLAHLMFNGGIQIPGVAVVLWCFLAMATQPSHQSQVESRPFLMGAFLAYVGLMVALARFHILPMIASRAAIARGNRHFAVGALDMAVAAYEQATTVCPHNCTAWAALTRARLMLATARPLEDLAWPLAVRAAQEWHRCDPASPWPCRDLALLWLRHATATGRQGSWEEAIRWIRRARERYPGDLELAYLEVRILHEAGRTDEARALARSLLDRNERYPHPDRKLSPEQVQNLRRWAGVGKQ